MASNYFDAASQGYVNVQQQIAQMGLLGGSMQPMDGRGAAVQIPTMPPPQFTATIATTGAFMPEPLRVLQLVSRKRYPRRFNTPDADIFFCAPNPSDAEHGSSTHANAAVYAYSGPPPTVMPMPIGGLNAGGIGGVMSDMAIAGGTLCPDLPGGLSELGPMPHLGITGGLATVGKGLEFEQWG